MASMRVATSTRSRRSTWRRSTSPATAITARICSIHTTHRSPTRCGSSTATRSSEWVRSRPSSSGTARCRRSTSSRTRRCARARLRRPPTHRRRTLVTTSPLRELQQRLRALIADPATTAGALGDLDERIAELPIRSDGRLSAAERVRIYARMYFLRLRDALADDYPALRRALGDEAFDALAQRYVTSHPSDRPSLRALGRHLPGFLHADANAPRWHAELAQ